MKTYVNTPDQRKYIFYRAPENEEFHFEVCCSNDCHVALTNDPHETGPMYEIAIGGWKNTKSIIRYVGRQPDVAAAATPNIVNEHEMRGFWVRWRNQTISVGRKGESLPFMSHQDLQMFNVNFVAICTAYGSTGSWLFDDPFAGVICEKEAKLESIENMKFVKTPNEKKYKYYPAHGEMFAFYVCCANDCHVSLSNHADGVKPLYEIAIGGWANTKSIIRLIGKEPDLVAAQTPDICSPHEMRGFWVRWDYNCIQVGRKGEAVAFMSYHDKNLFPINYVGICTAYGSTGTWFVGENTFEVSSVPVIPNMLADNSKLHKLNTPNEKRYRFYSVHGNSFLFKVKCANDCHVALSSNNEERLPLYEIVLGGWANTKSVIRKNYKTPDLVEVQTPQIVNVNVWRTFWLCWQDNVIQVGREGESLPFMTYKDPNLFCVKYLGICTAYGSSGSWLFNKSLDDVLISNRILKVKTPKEKSYVFYPIRRNVFQFKVKCAHDCHIALSAQPLVGLPMYEIVIGAMSNTKSVIRDVGMEPPEVFETASPDIVNAHELCGFWIHWNNTSIAVGREGEKISFMFHKGVKLFPIKYIGISTGSGATGYWEFEDECGIGGSN
uniref:Farnesoic acid O-methyl transferase domain-containing protein n=1 Tax=Musca domestica TaxID=7370 RepID=A0A1I8MIG9_MUSDO